jgi:CheY-like chemotaxis protein
MEAIGTLAGGVAHDLNNVLGGIVGYPDLLLHDIPEDSPMRSSLMAIKQSGQRASAIVQDLLTLARRGVQITEVVNLNAILTNCLESVEYEKLEEFNPDVKIVANLEKDLLNILGSPLHLTKTVINLLSNAVEATPGSGKIIITSENRYLDKPIKGYDRIKEGDYVVLSVKDKGTGIASEDLEKIFEPFYTKKVMGRSGTGLGMAVVWGTVKDHQGYIDVESIEGQGTTFTLYFPVTRKEIEIVKEPVLIEEYSGNGEKILVVDDVETQRDVAATLLKKLNYTVDTVASGEEALEYMRKNTADLLVLDMIMDPGIDGLDTYRSITEMYPGHKAIIASGFSETDRVREAQKLGAGTYIRKPYTLEKIGLAVKAELKKKK